MLLVKEPVPVPSLVLLEPVDGFCEVPQQTPRAVTSDPPSLVIFPPASAAVWVIPVMLPVVKAGNVGCFSLLHEYIIAITPPKRQ
jgi:hypothetical protein